MATSSLILILNVTMLLVNATVSSVQSLIIWKAVKKDDK